METTEIKKDFHQLIDTIENEDLLKGIYSLLKRNSVNEGGQLWNNLTFQEQRVLLSALEEIDDPNQLKTFSEIRKKHKKWL